MSATFVIAQGGGPTAVINQTLVGAVLEARRRHPGAKVLGARHGVRGIRDGDYVDLSAVPEAQLRLIAGTPSAALGSTRDKPDAAYCEVVLAGLKKVGADAFIYIGGNDTAGTQQILTEAAGGAMAFVHAPKTIDNDLVDNDHTPGFISAGEFVAAAFLSVDLDFRALPGVYVGDRHGPPCRLPDGSGGGLAARRRQRPASGLRAGARLLGAALHRRRAQDARPSQALHRRGVGRRVDRGRPLAGRKHRAGRPPRARRAWQRQAVRHRSRRRLRAGAGRRPAGQAGPRRHAGLHAARRHLDDQQGRRAGKPSTPAPSRSRPPARAAVRSRCRSTAARR